MRRKAGAPLKLRSGIRSDDGIPENIIRPVMGARHGTDDTSWASMLAHDMRFLVYITIGADTKDLRLPYSEMTIEQLLEWTRSLYKCNGFPLKDMEWRPFMQFDWELDIGMYKFVLPAPAAEMGAETPIETIMRRRDGRVARLPAGFQCLYKDIGMAWKLQDNYSEALAKLVNVRTEASIPVHGVFRAQAA